MLNATPITSGSSEPADRSVGDTRLFVTVTVLTELVTAPKTFVTMTRNWAPLAFVPSGTLKKFGKVAPAMFTPLDCH